MDFLENLSVCYSTLTKQGKRLADYIRANPAAAVHMTAKALGTASGTSAAAVVRTSRRLGYDSLEGLKIHLSRTMDDAEMNLPPEPFAPRANGFHDLGRTLFTNITKAMQDTLELVDMAEYRRAVTLLKRARVVYLFGFGGSAVAALDLSHKLNRIGKPCVFFSDPHTNLEFATVTTKRDAVVAFSYSGETKEVFLAAEGAQDSGAPVIAVTRNRASSLSARSNIVLRLPES